MSNGSINEVSTVKAADDFARKFLDEIKAGAVADNLPNNGQRIDDEYIAQQVKAYKQLINSKICDHLYE